MQLCYDVLILFLHLMYKKLNLFICKFVANCQVFYITPSECTLLSWKLTCFITRTILFEILFLKYLSISLTFQVSLIDLSQCDIQIPYNLKTDNRIWQCVNSSWTGTFKINSWSMVCILDSLPGVNTERKSIYILLVERCPN